MPMAGRPKWPKASAHSAAIDSGVMASPISMGVVVSPAPPSTELVSCCTIVKKSITKVICT